MGYAWGTLKKNFKKMEKWLVLDIGKYLRRICYVSKMKKSANWKDNELYKLQTTLTKKKGEYH